MGGRRGPPTAATAGTAPSVVSALLSPAHHKRQRVVVGVVAVAVFANSLTGGFVFDDVEAVVKNPDVYAPSHTLSLWGNDFWGVKMSAKLSHKSYRPVTVLTFRLSYLLSGLDPVAFHWPNVALHGANSILVLELARMLTAPPLPATIAPVAALLFATHPIHCDAVASVVGRAELLSAFFFLLSFLLFAKRCLGGSLFEHAAVAPQPKDSTRRAGKKTKQGTAVLGMVGSSETIAVVGVVVLGAAAMLSKEPGVTVLALCLGVDVLVALRAAAGGASPPLQGLARRASVLVLGIAVLLGMRMWVMGGPPPAFALDMNPAAFHPSRTVRALTFAYLAAYHMWMLVFPVTLCCDWSMGSIPLVLTVSDPRNGLTLLVLALLTAAAAYTLLRLRSAHSVLVGTGVGALVLTFLPASNLLFVVGFVVAERVLYLPSVGFCVLAAWALETAREWGEARKGWRRSLLRALLPVVLVLFAAKTISRNPDWATEETLFKSGVSANPNNAKLWYNLGVNQPDDLAMGSYRQAVGLWDDYPEAWFNLANLYVRQGMLQEAEGAFTHLLALDPVHTEGRMNFANMLRQSSRTQEAMGHYRTALEHEPAHRDTLINLGDLLRGLGEETEAISLLTKAVALDGSNPNALTSLGLCYLQLGDAREAERLIREALSASPSHPSALQAMGVVRQVLAQQQQR